MILTCPNCTTRYQTDAVIAAPGRNVRCAKCGQVWFQGPPEPEPEPEPELELQPEAAVSAGMAGSAAVHEHSTVDVEMHGHDHGHVHQAPRRRSSFLRIGAWILLILVVIAAIFVIVNYRHTIASLWPKTASLYAAIGMKVNVMGLAFRDVTPAQSLESGEPLLEVKGSIVNVTRHRIPVPKVRVALFDTDEREIYKWVFEPGLGTLEPGTSGEFVTRLPSPPREAKNILVRFAAAGDQ